MNSTPMREFGFPGLKPGDRWCLCASRWQEAFEAHKAPRVVLRVTHEAALSYCARSVISSVWQGRPKDSSTSSSKPMMEGPGAESEEKREPASDIETAAVDSLKCLTQIGRLEKQTSGPYENLVAMCQSETLGRVQ